MRTVFEMSLIDGNIDDAVALIKDTYSEVRCGKRSIDECVIPSAVKSDANSPHLRGMRNAEALLGVQWRGYDKPRLLYCKHPVAELCLPSDYKNP